MARWLVLRTVLVFLVGCAVIADALLGQADSSNNIAELIIGLVLVGVIPVADLVVMLRGRNHRD